MYGTNIIDDARITVDKRLNLKVQIIQNPKEFRKEFRGHNPELSEVR